MAHVFGWKFWFDDVHIGRYSRKGVRVLKKENQRICRYGSNHQVKLTGPVKTGIFVTM